MKRCYENLCRAYIEQQSGKTEFAKEQAKRQKYRSRRERVCYVLVFLSCLAGHDLLQKFQRRSSVVTKGEREKYWKHLSLAYVTEESDDPDNPNGIIEHKLLWRSESELNYGVMHRHRKIVALCWLAHPSPQLLGASAGGNIGYSCKPATTHLEWPILHNKCCLEILGWPGPPWPPLFLRQCNGHIVTFIL